MKSRFVILLIFAFSFLIASGVSAQVPISIGGLELSASTDNPAPNQKVTLTARSYTIDINSSRVTWVVSGKTVQNAVGATVLEITAPALGKKISVNVTATTPEGRVVSASITIGSGSVDLILESDGYTPSFYKGKISPVYQNGVKIIAMPHIANSSGTEYDPRTLVYQWKRNDRALEDQSGYGKQSVFLVGDLVPRPYTISVDVWSRDNTAHAQAEWEVGAGDPDIRFYVNDPLYGTLFNRAVGSTIGIGSQKETSIQAVPFGMNGITNNEGTLSFAWSINNSTRSELSTSRSIILRAPEDTTGSSEVKLDIQNTDKILQHLSDAFTASFISKKTTDEQVTF